MEIKKIKQLIDLLDDTDITEFELSEGDDSVKICKSTANTVVAAPIAVSPAVEAAAPVAPVAPAPSSLNIANESDATPTLGRTIKSPMVGTFYSAPSPDSDPFVSVGQHIKKGDSVCIVEAMKMFNKIEADIEGTIKQVLINDGDPVEFDQPLFEIE